MRDLEPTTDRVVPAISGARRVFRDLALFLPHFVLLIKRLIGDPRVPRRSKCQRSTIIPAAPGCGAGRAR